MKYAFFTFSGYSFPIAKRLHDEGNEVVVGVVSAPEKLKVSGWQGKKESPEERRRRMSIYDGMIEKTDADALVRQLRHDFDKGTAEDWFVVVDHNNLCEYGEKLLDFGAIGFIPNRADYDREKDRAAAKKFVEKNYDCLELPESMSLRRVEDGIAAVEGSDDLWVLKSNGNIGATIVPKTCDVQLNHMEIVGALKNDKKDYESEGFVIEKKILSHVEFTPEIAFWNGTPIYSNVEIECKPIGAGDTGPDGGGAINLMVRTKLDDPINTLFFPPIVHKLASSRRGLFIFDAGVLYDTERETFCFTEFAGNRWSYGGVFSELAMATERHRTASEYFERVAAGRNPLRYNFGATVSLYNILPDKKVPSLEQDEIPVYWRRAADEGLWLVQVKKNAAGECVNVGDGDPLLGYASACSDSLSDCISSVYRVVENFSFREVLFRPESDFRSRDYSTAILNRFEALNKEHFSVPGYRNKTP